MILWIDIDDLLFHLLHHGRPSGIQRVVFEISAALRTLRSENVQFVRRGPDATHPHDFRTVNWAVVETLFRQIMAGDGKGTSGSAASLPPVTPSIDRIPSEKGLSTFLQAEGRTFAGLRPLPATLGQLALRAGQRKLSQRRNAGRSGQYMEDTKLADAARPGDVFLTLGAPWHRRDYDRLVRWLRDDLRMSYGLLMYDLVPVRCPEWCNRDMILAYTEWHENVLPLTDIIFAISKATAADVQSYLTELDIGTSITVQPIPLGTGFGLADMPVATAPLVTGPYVLFVSTIEARKNHALLFRVWRRLLEDLPEDQVPTLVFAGREGWLVSDLMQQLENTCWLNGKIRFIQNPTDAELRRLYADCSFTVFPSFFEGWGLPVTESLSMGRPCVASGTTSIPEAGGSLARYFNPRDTNDAYRLIRDTITNQPALGEWTKQVRSRFKPLPWTNSARAILTAFDSLIS